MSTSAAWACRRIRGFPRNSASRRVTGSLPARSMISVAPAGRFDVQRVRGGLLRRTDANDLEAEPLQSAGGAAGQSGDATRVQDLNPRLPPHLGRDPREGNEG